MFHHTVQGVCWKIENEEQHVQEEQERVGSVERGSGDPAENRGHSSEAERFHEQEGLRTREQEGSHRFVVFILFISFVKTEYFNKFP